MTPSKRKPTAKPEPMSPAALRDLRNAQRMAEQDAANQAAERHFKNPDPEMPKKAKGGKVMAKPGSKMPPMFAKKAPAKAPAKAGMKRMMGGGSCK